MNTTKINKNSLSRYLNDSDIVKKIDSAIAEFMGAKEKTHIADDEWSDYLERIDFFCIETIPDLDSILRKNWQKIIDFAKHWIRGKQSESIQCGITIFYMGLFLVGMTKNPETINKYVNTFLHVSECPLGKKILEIIRKLKL